MDKQLGFSEPKDFGLCNCTKAVKCHYCPGYLCYQEAGLCKLQGHYHVIDEKTKETVHECIVCHLLTKKNGARN